MALCLSPKKQQKVGFLRQIIKSQLEKALFIVLVISLMFISGIFAVLGGKILASLGVEGGVTIFFQLGLFILFYFLLAQIAASKLK